MMKQQAVKIGVGFALLWCVIKFGYYLVAPFAEIKPMVMINILLMLSAIAFSLYLTKRQETQETNALFDIKNAMRAGFPYTLVVGSFLFLFYSKIHPEYNKKQLSDWEYGIQSQLNNPKTLKKFKKENPSFEVKTKEEIFSELQAGAKSFYSATAIGTISLLSMLLLCTLYSILVVVVYRRIVFRQLPNAQE